MKSRSFNIIHDQICMWSIFGPGPTIQQYFVDDLWWYGCIYLIIASAIEMFKVYNTKEEKQLWENQGGGILL